MSEKTTLMSEKTTLMSEKTTLMSEKTTLLNLELEREEQELYCSLKRKNSEQVNSYFQPLLFHKL
jgi:hypothetical protein